MTSLERVTRLSNRRKRSHLAINILCWKGDINLSIGNCLYPVLQYVSAWYLGYEVVSIGMRNWEDWATIRYGVSDTIAKMLPLIFDIVRAKLICETTTHATSYVAGPCLSLRVKVRFDYIGHPEKIAEIQTELGRAGRYWIIPWYSTQEARPGQLSKSVNNWSVIYLPRWIGAFPRPPGPRTKNWSKQTEPDSNSPRGMHRYQFPILPHRKDG